MILDNSRVYVLFLPFVDGRGRLGRLDMSLSILEVQLELRETSIRQPRVYPKPDNNPQPASISDGTVQMDHNAVVLFTIDRLARSSRATVRRRSTELAPDP